LGKATTAVKPEPLPRSDWRNAAVAPSEDLSAQPSWLPDGPAKHSTRWIVSGPVTVACAAEIGTSHSVPTTFQYSSSWSEKLPRAPRTVYPMV
jgi:hypothetical protein